MLKRSFLFYLIVIAISYGTGGTMYCVVVFNNAAPVIQNFTSMSWHNQIDGVDENIGKTIYNILTAMPMFGAIFGSLAGDRVAEKMGRKSGILLTSTINIVGTMTAALSTCVNVFELMIIGRFIQGFAMGLAFCVGGMFIAEISPTSRRSSSLPLLEVAVTTACLLGAVLGAENLLGSLRFIWFLQGIQAIPSFLTLIWLPFCPDTPNYLYLTKGDHQKAVESILFYQGDEYLATTLKELEAEERHTMDNSSSKWSDLISLQYRKLFLIAMGVIVGHAASGTTVVSSFSTLILLDSGLSLTAAQHTTNIALLVAVVAAVFWNLVVQRTVRRPVFLTSLFASCISLTVFCIFNHYAFSTTWAPIVCQVAIVVATFMLYGCDMVHWFIVEEMFDQKSRSKAVAIGMTISWSIQTLSVYLTLIVVDKFGPGIALAPIALVSLVTGIFAAVLLPETKKKTFLEVMLAVQGIKSASTEEITPLLAD